MSNYPIYTPETAPDASKPDLERLQGEIGFVPNLAAAMAGSPAMIGALTSLRSSYMRATLPAPERELVLLTVAVEYGNAYGVALHSTVAKNMGVPGEVIASIRGGRTCPDSRVDAIARLARSGARGEPPSSDDLKVASTVGIRNNEVLDAMTGVVLGKLAAVMHSLAPDTPLDDAFRPQAWTTQEVAAG